MSDSAVVDSNLEQEASQVEQAITNAISLVRDYSERNPYDEDEEENNPWRDPEQMLKELNHARDKILAAWDNMTTPSVVLANEEKKEFRKEDDFRVVYMDMITDAFADVLENFRNANHNCNMESEVQHEADDEFDLDILVDCLQSGMDFLSADEKSLFLMDDNNYDYYGDERSDAATTTTTPHEQRRRQLGFHVEVPS